MLMSSHNDSRPRQRAGLSANPAPARAIYLLCFDISTNRGALISFVLINLQKTGGCLYPMFARHILFSPSSSLSPLFALDTKTGGG